MNLGFPGSSMVKNLPAIHASQASQRGRCFSRRPLPGLHLKKNHRVHPLIHKRVSARGLVKGGNEADDQWVGSSQGGNEGKNRRANGGLPAMCPTPVRTGIFHPGHRTPPAGLMTCLLRRKRQPTPVFLPGESQGWRRLVGCRLWGCTESDTTEATEQQQQPLLFS